MTRTLSTLATHCAINGLPYHELARATPAAPIVGIELGGFVPHTFGSPTVYCANVCDVHIFGHSYIRHGDTFITDGQSFALDPARSGFDTYADHTDSRPATPYISPGECIFLGGHWFDPSRPDDVPNFGHFMFEFASRLAIFDRMGLLHLPAIVYQTLPKKWLDFLSNAGVERFIYVDPERPPNFANIWVTSCPFQRDASNTFYVWQPAVHWLRARLTRGYAPGRPRRIYLARGPVKHRALTNEAEATAMLAQYGFEVIDSATLSAAEQVQAMADAECVVAPAGAGTIITQFCPEHCPIILLTPQGKSGYWGGWAHAIHLRQSYTMLYCEHVANGQERIDRQGVNELSDMRVNVADLEIMVRAALGKR